MRTRWASWVVRVAVWGRLATQTSELTFLHIVPRGSVGLLVAQS
jgi:hypothetical protein